MNNNLILGIDGGGTKTEVLISDFEGNKINEFYLKKGCNPNFNGIENSLNVLNEILNNLTELEKNQIKICYAGISGCQNVSENALKIEALLKTYFNKVIVSGDLLSNFKAISNNSEGLNVIAGTGSAITYVYDNKIFNYKDEISYGGRQIGFLIVNLLKNNLFVNQEIENLFYQNILKNDLNFSNNFNDFFNDEKIISLTENFAKIVQNNIEYEELNQIFNCISYDWIYKISIFIQKFNLENKNIDAVFTGSLWKFEKLRNCVFQNIKNQYPNLNLLYNNNIKPVIGCIKLARS